MKNYPSNHPYHQQSRSSFASAFSKPPGFQNRSWYQGQGQGHNQSQSQNQNHNQSQNHNHSQSQSQSQSQGQSQGLLVSTPFKSKQEDSRTEIMSLHRKIQYLQGQLEEIMGLINQSDQSESNGSERLHQINAKFEQTQEQIQKLEHYSKQLAQNLQRSQEMNKMLQKQLKLSENNNQELRNSFEKINIELETLKFEITSNDQKNDQREEVEDILQKFHKLNIEYNALQDQKEGIVDRLKECEGLKQQLQGYRAELQIIKQREQSKQDQIRYLKDQISKVSDLAIENQRQVIEKYEKKMMEIRDKSKEGEQESHDKIENLRQLSALSAKIKQLQRIITEKDMIATTQQQQLQSLNHKLQETEYYKHQLQHQKVMLEKQKQILQTNLHEVQENSKNQLQQKKKLQEEKQHLAEQLGNMKLTLQMIKKQVRKVVEIKQSYAKQIEELKQQIMILTESEERGISRISQLENRHQQLSQNQLNKLKLQYETELSQFRQKGIKQIQELKQQLHQLNLAIETKNQEIHAEKLGREKQRNNYKQIIEEYKTINDEISQEISTLRSHSKNKPQFFEEETYNNSVEQHFQVLLAQQQSIKLKRELQSAQSVIRNLQKEMYELRFSMFSSKAHETKSNTNNQNQQLVRKHREQIDSYKEMIRILQNSTQTLTKQYNQWKHRIQLQYINKLQIQRTQIINQYRTILHQRQSNSMVQIQNYNTLPYDKIKYHPQVKRLQQQILALNRKAMEEEQENQRKMSKFEDQINKLEIQNKFHKHNMDEILRDKKPGNGYWLQNHGNIYHDRPEVNKNGLKNERSVIYEDYREQRGQRGHQENREYGENRGLGEYIGTNWKHQYDEVSKQYKQLYENYMKIKNQLLFESMHHKNQLYHNVESRQSKKDVSFLNSKPKSNLFQIKDESVLSLQLSNKDPNHMKRVMGSCDSRQEKDVFEHEASQMKNQRNQLISKIRQQLNTINHQ